MCVYTFEKYAGVGRNFIADYTVTAFRLHDVHQRSIRDAYVRYGMDAANEHN